MADNYLPRKWAWNSLCLFLFFQLFPANIYTQWPCTPTQPINGQTTVVNIYVLPWLYTALNAWLWAMLRAVSLSWSQLWQRPRWFDFHGWDSPGRWLQYDLHSVYTCISCQLKPLIIENYLHGFYVDGIRLHLISKILLSSCKTCDLHLLWLNIDWQVLKKILTLMDQLLIALASVDFSGLYLLLIIIKI